jgi:hypothetical protein
MQNYVYEEVVNMLARKLEAKPGLKAGQLSP